MRLFVLFISFLALAEAVQEGQIRKLKHHRHRIHHYRHHHHHHEDHSHHNDHFVKYEDCCFDAVKGRGGSPPRYIRKHDCSSFIAPKPAPTTTTVTVTSQVTELERMASVTAFYSPQTPDGCEGIPDYVTGPCSCDPSKYSSACSRWGVTTGINSEPGETITTTVTSLTTVHLDFSTSYDSSISLDHTPQMTDEASTSIVSSEPSDESTLEASSPETTGVVTNTVSDIPQTTELPPLQPLKPLVSELTSFPTETSTPTAQAPVSPLIQRCSEPLVCSSLSACSPIGDCLCQPSVNGEGFCLADRPCVSLTTCERDADCGDGSACMVTCCSEAKCLDLPWLCANPTAPRRMFVKLGRSNDQGTRVVRRVAEGEVVLERWSGHIVLDGSGSRSGSSSSGGGM